MKKQCSNHPKYMYSGKESSPLGLGFAAEPFIIGTIQEGRDKTNWIVALKNGVKVWSRITRLSEMKDKEKEPSTPIENDEEAPIKKKTTVRKKTVKKDDELQNAESIQDITNSVNNEEETTKEPAKRKPTNYNIYMKYKLKELKNSSMKPKERVAHAVSLWKSMDENEKQEIIDKARIALENGEI